MGNSSAEIPAVGRDRGDLLQAMKALCVDDVRWRDHRAFGLVYQHSEGHTEFLKEAYGLFFCQNGLNPMAFKSLQRMEREVAQMTAKMFHGDKEVVGCMTSGGTESLLLTVLTYRNHARRKRPWIRRPEVILPESAHVAFIKAGEYFGVRMIKTPLTSDYRADVEAMERRISRNTIALVASAPCYPYGVIDPVEEMGAVAERHGLPLHVDGCLGGFFLPWVEKLGGDVPRFDFRVPAVTSISADLHKYGYAAKGASTILYRNMDLFRDQIFADVDWCGGVYGGATMAGTRPGGPIAAAWASLQALGENGFMENARKVMAVTERFSAGIRSIPELEILGRPVMGVIAYGAKEGRISGYAIADRLEQRGWHVDRLQHPEAIHVILNSGHEQIVDQYVADLRAAVEEVKAYPEAALSGSAPMYGLIAKAPMRRMVWRNVVSILAQMYSQKEQADSEGEADGHAGEDVPSVPKPLLQLMRLKARLGRLFGRKR